MSIKLSNRLKAIADFVKKGSRVIDVGTDHGYIPVYLIQNGICDAATASDINEGPLMSARKTAAVNGVTDKIKFIHNDGLRGITEKDGDTIVIAGMGGETIIGILSAAEWVKNENISLILQPQSKISELTLWLNENGFSIKSARLAKDDGKIYLILSVHFIGGLNNNNVFEILSALRDELLIEYLDSFITKNEKALKGMRKSERRTDEEERMIAYNEKIKKLKEELLGGNGK